jgi:alkanesulfonate monooxygenase SsuD/methylene tetrahydromethanopterin reductase-like flavin-dependent oxidoreductase (luciferase family)
MLIGHFTEQPWQHPNFQAPVTPAGGTVYGYADLDLSNGDYDPVVGHQLYNRYIDEKLYAEEVGFDALMLNEHHSAPFCMQGVTNVEACILARQTKNAKIVILGNVMPIWDDPLWLAEQLSMIDMISHGRLVSGWVRGTGRESVTHNANPTFNRERWEESHQFIVKTWTTPGPFRWEGKHYQYRYVNPWAVPMQRPHPPIWIPGVASQETVIWTAKHHFPYVMLATLMEPTKQYFKLYHDTAAEAGYKSGTQNLGYLFKVHVEETEEKADEVGRKYIRGVNNPFNTGNEGRVRPWIQSLPGITSRDSLRRSAELFGRAAPVGRGGQAGGDPAARGYEAQVQNLSIISGTPKTVLPKIRQILQELRPGSVFFWDGDGLMEHDDQVRSLRLHGQDVIPAAREMGKELGLLSPYEVNDGTGFDQEAWKRVQAGTAPH